MSGSTVLTHNSLFMNFREWKRSTTVLTLQILDF
jgi:hypothetical protein